MEAEFSKMESHYPFEVLLLDIDGVQTNGSIFYSSNGDQLKAFNARDGVAIKKFIESGVFVAMLSNSLEPKLVQERCKTLGIKLFSCTNSPKIITLREWAKKYDWKMQKIAYIGDDINDIDVLNEVGYSICPKDSHPSVIKISKLVTCAKGGDGVVREVYEKFSKSSN